MRYSYLKKQREEKVVLDTQAVSNPVIILLFILLFFTAGCSASKEVAVKEKKEEKKDINYTQYDLLYVEGVKKKLEGELAEAIYKLDDAVRINPGSDAAHYQISQVAAMRRDYDNAVKYGRRAIKLDGENPWYYMNMADIYMQLSDLDSTAYYLEQLILVDPEREDVELQLGNIYMETGNNAKAERIFEKFYQKYGAGEEILVSLLTAKVNADKYDEAKDIILKELESNPDDTQLNGLLAEIYRKKGEPDKAAGVYERMLNLSENNNTLDFSYLEFLIEEGEYTSLFENFRTVINREDAGKENIVNMVLRMIQDSMIVNNYSDSLVSIGRFLMDQESEDPTMTLLMSEIYKNTGYKNKEVEVLIDFVERNDELYFIWENLLLKLNEREDTEQLNIYAGKASALFNRAPLPKILYAYSLIDNGKWREAEEELKKVRMLVNNEPQYMVQILSMEAEIAYREGEMEKAFEKFDEAMELEPDNPMVLNNYSYYLAEKNIRLDEAEGMIEKCLEIEENVTYLDTYAWILYKKGEYRDANRIMNRIFTSTIVTDAELREHYGYIKKALGECDAAVALWQAALKEDRTKSYLIEEINKCVEEK
ncbi:MAG: tetratricopeptide repeat protein [Bacteroidales bacterium]